MNSKIVIGIIVVILVVAGISYAASSSDSNEDFDVISSDNPTISDDEGKQFSMEFSDSVTASGP